MLTCHCLCSVLGARRATQSPDSLRLAAAFCTGGRNDQHRRHDNVSKDQRPNEKAPREAYGKKLARKIGQQWLLSSTMLKFTSGLESAAVE